MKLLLLYAHDFWLRPYVKSWAAAAPSQEALRAHGAVVALVHVEAEDEAKQGKVVTKCAKNVKWLAGKFQTRDIVLHSFAHLSGSKAAPETAAAILRAVEQRLNRAGYRVQVTPFGYFNEFRVHVAGPSLAKVFVEL